MVHYVNVASGNAVNYVWQSFVVRQIGYSMFFTEMKNLISGLQKTIIPCWHHLQRGG